MYIKRRRIVDEEEEEENEKQGKGDEGTEEKLINAIFQSYTFFFSSVKL